MFQTKPSFLPLLLFFVFISLVGCKDLPSSSNTSEDGQITTERYHPFDVNKHALNKVVCDPMGDEGQPGPQDGLIASLYYLEASQPRYRSTGEYIELGTKSNQKLFFSKVDIPTRLFDTGFPTETGSLIEDDQGDVLHEYFALRFKSVLRLSENDEEGEYELALLSDDGAVLKIMDEEGQYQVVVDNDGNHPTRMGCGETITMDYDTSLDIQMDYYQGPRRHIALIPMWRKVDAHTSAETYCGRRGNSLYFDYNNNSNPRQAYLDMLLRGWKPIDSSNWHLPPSAIYNPCSPGKLPIISDLNIRALGDGVVRATWSTDIPATSQLLYRDSQGQETLTQSDNVLRTQHSIILGNNLNLGSTYTFQAISISEDLGKSLSRPLDITIF